MRAAANSARVPHHVGFCIIFVESSESINAILDQQKICLFHFTIAKGVFGNKLLSLKLVVGVFSTFLSPGLFF